MTFQQDFASGEVDETLYPLYSGSSLFPILVVPNGTVVSASNPSYSGTFVLLEYTPLSGGVGDLSTMDVEFRNASQAGIGRSTV